MQFQHGNVRVKSWQPMSNSWSTSSQPDFLRALGRRKTVRNRRGKILYTELLKSWSTLGQFLANSPFHGKLQGSSSQYQGQKGTPKNLCDKDFAELSGELSGAIRLKTLVFLGSALLELFKKFFGAVRAILWLWGSFLALDSSLLAMPDLCPADLGDAEIAYQQACPPSCHNVQSLKRGQKPRDLHGERINHFKPLQVTFGPKFRPP